ncbi:gliding motility-associated C-terminal domain-containing protein [Aquimarina sp. ERC-38]|uniref:T9SS type B sorting domain-containing protein n=1 Tax=Aquimarina sp. ERC-38 TaxID=2949996 RepID=UPI00224534C3|nr:gliding motility-associated C-terminal domain-containing protein [Aquimarina sp. ERC-38]UZO81845.1 gliding motility-associated C-terminal domain-containing protein [Aquimarina sp. ERC-38]
MTSLSQKYDAMNGKTLLSLWVLLFVVSANLIYGQSRSIQKPELQNFSSACATTSKNEFTVLALLSPGAALPNGNEFILQRSDPNGDFSNAIELARANGPNNGTSSEQEIEFENFSIPTTSSSDTYKLRVIASLDDKIISEISDDTPMHFFRDSIDLRLNDRKPVIFCNVETIRKELVIEVLDKDKQPIDPEQFEWEWFRVEGVNNDILIPGENGTSLTVTSEGTYVAKIPLGDCQNIFRRARSNEVTVSKVEVDEVQIITAAPDFSFCPGEDKVLTYTNSSFNYQHQWFKDGEPIDKATGPNIRLSDNDFGGVYRVQLAISDECNQLLSEPVTVVNEGSSITKPLPEFLVRLPREVLNLEIETDAPLGSTIRWIVDTNIQSSGPLQSPTSSFDAPLIAVYRVEIDANDACNSALFSQTEILAPNNIIPVIGTDDIIDCSAEIITLRVIEVNGITNVGPVPLTEDQLTRLNFEWFKDDVSTGEFGREFEINRGDSESIYRVEASLDTGEFTARTSEELPILFLDNNIELTAVPAILSVEDDATVTITAPSNENFSYTWFEIVGGEERLIDGETINELIVSEPGIYLARIATDLCEVPTLPIEIGKEGEVSISELIPNIITPFGSPGINDRWVLPARFSSADVEVTIYNVNGQPVFNKTGGYNSEWPEMEEVKEELYFYIIKENQEVTKKGTITVMQ